MRLVERTELLGRLDGQLTSAAAGRGRLVLVGGSAGVGKTSLVQAFADRHRERARVFWGACDPLSTPRPLGPLFDIARRAGGELAALMASEASSHDRFSGFLDALVSRLRPVIMIVEDVHWADEATCDLLVFTARRIENTNGLLLVTYRDDETRHTLRQLLGRVTTLPAVDRVTVPPLSPAAVSELAAGRHPDPDRVYHVTGGNAFLVTEVLAAPTDTVPAAIFDTVRARVDELDDAARAALCAASVVPGRAELDLIRHVADVPPDAIDECVRAGMLHVIRDGAQFWHELVRMTIEQSLTAAQATVLHQRVLVYLEHRGGVEPARLAHHADHAADKSAILAHAPAAAEQATRVGAHIEAHAHLRRCVAVAGSLPAGERAALLDSYAEACTAVAAYADAERATRTSAGLWRHVGEVGRAASAIASRASVLWHLARFDEAYAVADSALAMLEGQPADATHARVYSRAANLWTIRGNIDEAIRLASIATRHAERAGEGPLLVEALYSLGTPQWVDQPEDAEATHRRALRIAYKIGDDAEVAAVLGRLGSGAGEARRYVTADHWLGECARWCDDRGLERSFRHAEAWRARSAFEQGRWTEAVERAERLITGPSGGSHDQLLVMTVLGRVRARRGEAGAGELLAQAWQLALGTSAVQRLWPLAAARAEAAWLSGEPERIVQLVGETYERAVGGEGHGWAIGELAFWLWRAGELDAVPAAAAHPYAEQMQGNWRKSEAAWHELGCPYEAALARSDSWVADDLVAALEVFGRLGARPMVERLTDRLRDLGVERLPRQPSRATVDNPAGLTDRELDVLALLVEGLTNAQIAYRLHISVKTAGHHVSAILNKLDARTRHDAARVARERGLPGCEPSAS